MKSQLSQKTNEILQLQEDKESLSIKLEDVNEEYQRLLDLKGLEDQIKAHPKY